jgi:hypothetical protein
MKELVLLLLRGTYSKPTTKALRQKHVGTQQGAARAKEQETEEIRPEKKCAGSVWTPEVRHHCNISSFYSGWWATMGDASELREDMI